MLEATKKRRTEHLREVRYIVPAEKIEKLEQSAKSFGLGDVSESIPWRDLFS
jgi:hypothetical protein